MGTHTGRLGSVKVGSNSVAEVKSFSVEETGDTAEDTSMGDQWRTYKPTLNSWSGSVEAQLDETDSTGQGALTVGAEVALSLYPDGETSGDVELTGNAIVTGVSRSIPFDGIVTVSFTFQGNGALTVGTVSA